MNRQISIIGCGWLGKPLAMHLNDLGYSIKGSTTSKEKLKLLSDHGIDSFIVELNEDQIIGDVDGFLSGSDIVVINIPPGLRRSPDKDHVAEIQHLMTSIQTAQVPHVVYISSTSVFEDRHPFPLITDDSNPDGSSKSATQLIAVEKLLQSNPNFKTTIIRFAGLIDENRHPAKLLSGKTNLKNGDAPVNLIHKQDCISAIAQVILSETWGATFNLAYPVHPTKKDYYKRYSKQHDIPLPHYDDIQESKGKIIGNTTMVQLLGYEFRAPI
ncbi:MAG: NAD(P)H-binding protein [Bacteroidota bacterium]